MANANDRFKVTISFMVEKIKEDGTLQPFANTTQDNTGLDYIQLVELQDATFSAVTSALLKLGKKDAEALKAATDPKKPDKIYK